jgi:hypothetical protein
MTELNTNSALNTPEKKDKTRLIMQHWQNVIDN